MENSINLFENLSYFSIENEKKNNNLFFEYFYKIPIPSSKTDKTINLYHECILKNSNIRKIYIRALKHSNTNHFKQQEMRDTNITTKKKNYFCKYCKKTYKTVNSLKMHLKIHNPKTPSCQYCGKKFTRQSYLEDHIRTHTGEKPFQCQKCNKTFRCQRNLSQHKIVHNPTRYKCKFETCARVFKTKQRMEKHYKNHL